jgi:hypothetical protein
MNRQMPVFPPYSDQEIPNRSGVPGLSEVVIGEYGGALPSDQTSNITVTRTAILSFCGQRLMVFIKNSPQSGQLSQAREQKTIL